MSGPRQIAAAIAPLYAGVGSPKRLDMSCLCLRAVLGNNFERASRGESQPTGDVLLGIGSEPEVRSLLATLKGQPKEGWYVPEYSPVLDSVRVSLLSEVVERGRLALRTGEPDAEGWYPVAGLGNREYAGKEATRLRRIRAGYRTAKVPSR